MIEMQRNFILKISEKKDTDIEHLIQKKSQTWLRYVAVRNELHNQGIVRSNRSPEAEFSEWLVKTILNGVFPYKKTNKYWDVETNDKKIQVKSISKGLGNNNGYHITLSDRSNREATHYAFVWFRNFVPISVYLIDIDGLRKFDKKRIRITDLRKIGTNIFIYDRYFQKENALIDCNIDK